MLNSLTNLFNIAGNKNVVGIAVTPNVGLEVIVIDKKTSQVVKYRHKPLSYNHSTREIDDYTELKSLITDIYSELNIDQKSDVYFVLPNVHFGFVSLPPIMIDEAIDNALLSKAEESYIFRRVEPKTAWADINFKNRTESRYIAYSAIQITVVDKIKDIITDLGGNLLGIETSYCALLRAIHYTGIVQDTIERDQNWNILLINSNSYALFSLSGERLVDHQEIPLALKSFSHEEAYQAIATSASQVLADYPATKLLVISQSDEISVDALKSQIIFDGEIQLLNCNKFTKIPVIDVSPSITDKDASTISLSAIGAATINISRFPMNLNVLRTTNYSSEVPTYETEIFGKPVVITSEMITKYSLLALAVFCVIFGLLCGTLFGVNYIFDSENKKMEANIQQLEAEIAKIEGTSTVNINNLINKIVQVNTKTMNFYDSLSLDIPKNIWLTYYFNKNGENIKIEGMSLGVSEIYNYFKNLKLISPESTIKLNKLKLITDMINGEYSIDSVDHDVKFYTFEIGNYDPVAAVAPTGQATGQDGTTPPPAGQPQNRTPGRMVPIAPQGNNSLEAPPDLEPYSESN